MNQKTLFLAWQDKARTCQWFPVGRLDVERPDTPDRFAAAQAVLGGGWDPGTLYRFRYLQGAERARRESGFEPLFDFPSLHQRYEASELFPLFQNRVIAPGRRDFQDYLRLLDLPNQADPIEILSVDGGHRVTDSFEVFPKIERRADGAFRCRFFLHGWRHVSEAAQCRLELLSPDEKLFIALELTNPVTGFAVQIQTEDYHMIGWAPRYLVSDLVSAITTAPGDYKAHVVQVNPVPAPSKQRLLVELSGRWPDYEPMTTADYEVLTM